MICQSLSVVLTVARLTPGLASARFHGKTYRRPGAYCVNRDCRVVQRRACQSETRRKNEILGYPKWIQHNLNILGTALEEIEQYSEGLRESDDPDYASVAEVLDWLKGKEDSLAEVCMIDGGSENRGCHELDQICRFVESLKNSTGVEDLAHVLICQCHAEKGKTQRKSGQPVAAHQALESLFSENVVPKSEELEELFNRMDRNKDAKLDILEFEEAMGELGETLSSPKVQLISEAFGIHGSIDMAQFLEIASAEEIRSLTQDSELLRRMNVVARDRIEKNTPDWGS